MAIYSDIECRVCFFLWISCGKWVCVVLCVLCLHIYWIQNALLSMIIHKGEFRRRAYFDHSLSLSLFLFFSFVLLSIFIWFVRSAIASRHTPYEVSLQLHECSHKTRCLVSLYFSISLTLICYTYAYAGRQSIIYHCAFGRNRCGQFMDTHTIFFVRESLLLMHTEHTIHKKWAICRKIHGFRLEIWLIFCFRKMCVHF